jgi:hypothetical protein
MSSQSRIPTRLFVAGALAVSVACSDHRPPTAPAAVPGDPSMLQGGNTRVKVKTLQLSANTLRIDGPGVSAQVSLANSGPAFQSGISLQAQIVQGSNWRVAADVPTQCNPGDSPGFLPTGPCDMTVAAAASNTAVGVGTLVPGAAVFLLRVLQADPTGAIELATKSVNVNLVATPGITSLTLASTTLPIDGPSINYTAVLNNPANTLQGVILQGIVVQGTTTRAAGGLSVSCGSALGVLPPGTCTVNFTVTASNSTGGSGTLVPGAATFQLSLIQSGTNTTFDTKSVAVTLISSTPTITSLVLQSTSLVIGGASVNYTVQIQNPGFPLTDIILQGEIDQTTTSGTVAKGAGGTYINCGGALGALPTTGTGVCTIQFTVTALGNSTGGAFVPGSASFVLHLYRSPVNGTQTELDSRTVAVTLTPQGPTITAITPASTSVVLGSGFTSETVTIDNPGADTSIVIVQNWIVQGSARRAAGGTDVHCGSLPIGDLPSGTCTTPADIVADNGPSSGTGTLVTGPATLEVDLEIYDGTIQRVIDTKTTPITLVP